MSLSATPDGRLASILPRLSQGLRESAPRAARGRLRRALGVVVHATVGEVRLGEICDLVDPRSGARVQGEVIGFGEDHAILVPIGDLAGLSSLTEVIPTGRPLGVPVGHGLLGRVMSPLGEALDGGPWPPAGIAGYRPVHAFPPPPLERALICEPVQTGVRAIDGLLTCARGQRLGIFGEPGIGKSTLLADIVRGTDADVVVIGLVGERGREVREFVERLLGPEGRARAVTVVATSERPAIERVKAAYVATTVAEYFRDEGKHVLLLMDSVTRFARAQREIGLAAGEPPTRRGFPPSLFAALPRLLERSGPGRRGAITGLYTVLVEGDGSFDPVAEEVQSILDGHIRLSAELAERGQFPAVDVLRSRSRLMDVVASEGHRADAARLRALLARYADVELLVRVGEYRAGSDAVADEAIAKIDRINAFLSQRSGEASSFATTERALRELVG
jgi:type III secretion protein N (ATPase)